MLSSWLINFWPRSWSSSDKMPAAPGQTDLNPLPTPTPAPEGSVTVTAQGGAWSEHTTDLTTVHR